MRASQLGQLCGLVGVVISVALGSINLWLPIFVGGSLMLTLGLFLVIVMPEEGFKPVPRQQAQKSVQMMAVTFKQGVRSVRGRPTLMLLLGIGFFAGATGEGFLQLWEAHLLTNFTFPILSELKPIIWFGILSIGTSLVCIAALQLLRRRLSKIMENANETARTLLWLNLLLIVSVIAFGLAGSFEFAVAALVLKAVLSTLAGPLYNTWLIQNIEPQVRATVLSMSSQIDALGQFVGGPFMGVLANAVSSRAAMVVTALVRFPNLVLYGQTLRHHKGETAPASSELENAIPEVLLEN